MYDLIIWDFNGTLLDDVETGILAVNTLLRERGLPEIKSRERYYEVFGFPIISYYEKLGFDFSKESYEELAHKWVDLYMEYLPCASAREETVEEARRLRRLGVRQIILSATEQTMLEKQVCEMGIAELFDEILGLSDIYAHSKKEMAVEWMKKQGVKNALLIGDSIHDLQVAEAIGAECVLVSGGHQSKSALIKAGATVCEPSELCGYIGLIRSV